MATGKNGSTKGSIGTNPPPVPLIQKVETYLSQRYDFKYNEVMGKVEFRSKGQSEFAALKDYDVNSLARELSINNFKVSSGQLMHILHSDYVPVYNPFEEYFNSLPPWEDGIDYIDLLASTITTSDDELWQKCLKKWLVAMVGCVLHEKVTNHTVIVLSGKQGIGKTTWLLNLVPAKLKEYKYSGMVNPNNKDTLVNLSETMLINMDELETLNRSELNSVKELITKEGIRIRRSYGRINENLTRRASFSGSVNGIEFLSDTTGNRRFLCFEAINIDYRHSIPLDMVYAQAKHLFDAGFKYWFDGAEISELNQSNEKFRTVTLEEELLLLNMEPCSELEADEIITTTQIAERLKDVEGLSITNAAVARLGKALTQHNFLRLKRKGAYCWAIKYKNAAPGK